MCGGAEDEGRSNKPLDNTYKAPDLRQNHQMFRETGRIPYSYYGQGSPSNKDELALVRASYPGAFSTPETPAQPETAMNPFQRLMTALNGLGELGNMHDIFKSIRDESRRRRMGEGN